MRHAFAKLTLALAACTLALAAADPARNDASLFERDVRPILKANCFMCHGEGEKPKSGVDLRLARFMNYQTEAGTVVVPGDPANSLLLQQIKSGEMPQKAKPLPPEKIAIIERWIATGAKTVREEPKEIPPGVYFVEEERQHWAFQPVKRLDPPSVTNKARMRTPIDAFLLAALEPKGLSFAPDADKRALIRRAHTDLTGLPPTPEEVDSFLADASPDAYEKLIDKLLASPHYGERWGRHWLDVAGYADSNGMANEDSMRPAAYKYRDYVIRSLNADKPFNEFITEQLAGDELLSPPYDDLKGEALDKLIATGFLRMAPDGTGDPVPDANLARNEVMADTLKIVSSSLLGLTVGCAQCHDHRYDPIPQADYYKLRAVFEPALDWKKWRKPAERQVALQSKEDRDKSAAIEAEAKKLDEERATKLKAALDKVFEKELAKLPVDLHPSIRLARNTPVNKRSDEQKQLLREHPSADVRGQLDLYDKAADDAIKAEAKKAADLRATKPQPQMVMALTEIPGQVPQTVLFNRGDHDQPKQELKPGGLSIIEGLLPQTIPEKSAELKTSGRRLAFAKLLSDPRNPLTARVLANRVWMLHFGRGIVNTPGDFGVLGEKPSHPELLDWLASEFVAGGWKLKPLHRKIMLSTAYRQSSRNPAALAADPDNRLLARASLKRLDAEALRDSILASTGKLNLELFGEPMPIGETKEGQIIIGRGTRDANGDPVSVEPLGEKEYRRSLYAQVRRKWPVGVLEVFDEPAMRPNCEARCVSTGAPQSLMLMNDALIVAQAKLMAERLRTEAPGDARKQIARAWRLLFLENPKESETTDSLIFLAEQTEQLRVKAPPPKPPPKDGKKPDEYDPQLLAMASLCQALMSSNRFLYVE